MVEPDRQEIWKDIPGFHPIYDGMVYQVSTLGRIRLRHPRGISQPPRILNAWLRKPKAGSAYMSINLHRNNTRKSYRVARLVWETFVGKPSRSEAIIHINGMKQDCRLDNLRCIKIKDLGIYGRDVRNVRGGVAKIDRDGNVLEWYKTGTEASLKNFISITSVYQRCNRNLLTDEYRYLGFTFRWANEIG